MKVPINTPIAKQNGLPTEDFVFFLQSLNKSSITLSDVNIIAGILFKFNLAKTKAYTEYIYSGDKITAIKVYEDSTKAVTLYVQSISYSGDNISSYTIQDVINSKTLTAVFSYSGDKIVSKNYSIS